MKIILYSISALLLMACGSSEPPAPAAEHHEESERIALSPDAIKAAGIEIAEAGSANIRQLLSLYGTVRTNAERTREVTARFAGVIRSVSKKVGDAVREGETLATVESNESLQTYPVKAPLSGVITARNANPGEHAGEAALFTVADLSTVWVELALFPRDLAKVHLGQSVRVKTVDGDLAAEGKIVYVSAMGQAASQTLTARVRLDNAERRWAPGLYVTGEVTLAQSEVMVAVKTASLQTVEGKTVVFVQNETGFAPQPVTLGISDGDHSEVREGLAAGARYAAAGSFVLKAELGKGEAGHED